MNILFDTNIIINIARVKDSQKFLQFLNPNNSLIYMSIVSIAEVKSFSIRKKWGENRINFLSDFLQTANIVDVDKFSVDIYSEIDTYSQR